MKKQKPIKVLYITTMTREQILEKPSNYCFYIKNMIQDNRINVILFNASNYNKKNKIRQVWLLLKKIREINPDVLYLPKMTGFYILVVLKKIGLFRCKIIAWKYTRFNKYNNFLLQYLIQHLVWNGIDKLYMMSETHVQQANKLGIMAPNKCVSLKWGVEQEWYDHFIKPHTDNEFTVIATGKDSRDYETLCRACDETQTKCIIITRRHESNIKVAKKWKSSKWCSISFIEDLNLEHIYEYEYIMEQTSKASILAIPCEQRSYGVGYTNLIEGLPYCIPILLTNNPDVPVNTEEYDIGYMIEPHDVENWKKHILFLKEHIEERIRIANNIQKMTKNEYNHQVTANYIINDILTITKEYKIFQSLKNK